MSITFGSVGDIISVCFIIKDLISALDETRGSSAEYREVIRELWGLDKALLEVDLLSRTCEDTIELNALCETAQQVASNCRLCIESFSKKIKKYRRSLGGDESNNFLMEKIMRIRWHTERDDLAKFRAEMMAHSSSMHMLLATAGVKLLKVSDKKHGVQMTDYLEMSRSQKALIVEVRDRLKENNSLIEKASVTTARIWGALRLDWFRQLASELKNLMQKIYAINFATYKAVIAVQTSLPSHLERSLIQEPFILEDAIGRILPVHTQFIGSWEAFDFVLENKFQKFQGYRKVKNREYVIQEHSTGREIQRRLRWEVSFLPGQRFDMSMIFERQEKVSNKAACPGCQFVSDELLNTEILCTKCGMWYRRITIYNEVPLPQIPVLPYCQKPNVTFGQISFSTIPFGPKLPESFKSTSKKRKLSEANLEETDDMTYFKRVRVISKKDRIKHDFNSFALRGTATRSSIMDPKAILDEEERKLRKSFETECALHGLSHPDTISSLKNLATCLRNMRKFAAAEDLFRAAFVTCKDRIDIGDPKALQSIICDLMTVLVDQNKVLEAVDLRQTMPAIFDSLLTQQLADELLKRLKLLNIFQYLPEFASESQKKPPKAGLNYLHPVTSTRYRQILDSRYRSITERRTHHGHIFDSRFKAISERETHYSHIFDSRCKAISERELPASYFWTPVERRHCESAFDNSCVSSRQRTSTYFINREDIDREVIITDISGYLGNDALVKPGIHRNEKTGQIDEGYYITACYPPNSAHLAELRANSLWWREKKREIENSSKEMAGLGYFYFKQARSSPSW